MFFSSIVFLRLSALLLAFSSLVFLILALCTPFIRISKFYFFNNEPALLQAFWQLVIDGHYLLTSVLILVTVVLPIFKLFSYVQSLFLQTHNSKWLKYMQVIAKWAMLDVLVVAMLLVSVKLGALAQITIQLGFYYFVCSFFIIIFDSSS